MLREAGRIVADTFDVLRDSIKPGITTAQLNAIAEEYILSRNAEPIYKGYGGVHGKRPQTVKAGAKGYKSVRKEVQEEKKRPPFPGVICVSVNDVICHGIPGEQTLADGDIIGIDIGVRYQGWVGDSCVTFPVGNVDAATQKLIDVTERCLALGIEQSHSGKKFGDIGAAIQTYAQSQGFSVVKEYTGHGVGRNLHEEPTILHYGEPHKGRRVLVGMVYTIEPMINAGKGDANPDDDGWTVRTADGSLSAQFEHQIAITDNGPIILTARS